MKDVSHFNKGDFSWTGSNEEFLEFVMIVADFVICNQTDGEVAEAPFSELCDTLAPLLIKLLAVDITPYNSFKELKQHIKPSYTFSKRIVKKLKEDYDFVEMLDNTNIMPSYETMKGVIVKCNNVEAFTTKLINYLRLNN
jgi:hypothetical protein